MKWFVTGIVAGSFITLAALTIVFRLPYAAAERELIDKWRQVHPGMPCAEVVRILGTPSEEWKPGTGFPDWAQKSVPEDYYLNHGLLLFTIMRMGPQLLLVYFDENNRVAFVSSTWT